VYWRPIGSCRPTWAFQRTHYWTPKIQDGWDPVVPIVLACASCPLCRQQSCRDPRRHRRQQAGRPGTHWDLGDVRRAGRNQARHRSDRLSGAAPTTRIVDRQTRRRHHPPRRHQRPAVARRRSSRCWRRGWLYDRRPTLPSFASTIHPVPSHDYSAISSPTSSTSSSRPSSGSSCADISTTPGAVTVSSTPTWTTCCTATAQSLD